MLQPVAVHCTLPSILWWSRAIQQPLALSIEIAEMIGLKPIGQDTEQQMTWQVRGCPPSEYRMPTRLQTAEVEIAQPRHLDLKRLRIRQRRTDLDAAHGDQAARRLDPLPLDFDFPPPLIR